MECRRFFDCAFGTNNLPIASPKDLRKAKMEVPIFVLPESLGRFIHIIALTAFAT